MRRLLNTIKYTWWWWGWQPWANTIVYFPLDTDLNDYSWNYTLTANNLATINTVDGVSCLDCSANRSFANCTISTLPQWTQARTNMFRVRWNALWQYPAYAYWTSQHSKADVLWHNNASSPASPSWSQYWWSMETNETITTGQWYHIAITIDGSTEQKIYQNWVLKNTKHLTVNTNWTTLYLWHCTWDGTYINWYLSKFIIEDRIRTAQEIEDYYNQTKANYWIQSLNNSLTITPNITPNIIIPDTPDNNWTWSVLSI